MYVAADKVMVLHPSFVKDLKDLWHVYLRFGLIIE